MVSSAILKIFKKVRLENYANLHFGRTGQNPTLRTTVSSDKNRHYQGRPKVAGQIALKRSLAKHLDVSIVTVETSYQQLKAEGYIYSQAKKGFL